MKKKKYRAILIYLETKFFYYYFQWIKVLTNILRLFFTLRITKEVCYYEKEVEKEKQRLDKMKNEGKDEYALRYQVSSEICTLCLQIWNLLGISYKNFGCFWLLIS